MNIICEIPCEVVSLGHQVLQVLKVDRGYEYSFACLLNSSRLAL